MTTTFTWDIASGLPVVLDDGNQYVYGAGLASMKQSGNWYYYLADGLGSTMAVVDSSGNSQKSYQYDVYGEVTGGSGSLSNEFDFAGQQTDATGLQYLRARYYDPETGTFLSREPLANSQSCLLNHYSYTGGRPTDLTDPSGAIPIGDEPGQSSGRSDCGGLWTKIANTLGSLLEAAKNWRAGNYGRDYVAYGPRRPMTPEERVSHYNQYNTLQRQIDDWNASGGSKQKQPCGPPPNGPFEIKADGKTTFLGREWS